MKKLFFGLAIVLLSSGAAMADSFSWTYSSSLFSASGTISVTGGVATSGTGSLMFAGDTVGLSLIPCATPGAGCAVQSVPGTGGANADYDDIIPVDGDGLAFTVGGTTDVFNPWNNEAAYFGDAVQFGGSQLDTHCDDGCFVAVDGGGTFTSSRVPEPSSLILLGFAIVGFGLAAWKKQSA